MISDDELKLMIHDYTIGTYSSSDEGDILSALIELEHYRRTFAKIEHRIVDRIERDILDRIGLSEDWKTMPEGTRIGDNIVWRVEEPYEYSDSKAMIECHGGANMKFSGVYAKWEEGMPDMFMYSGESK